MCRNFCNCDICMADKSLCEEMGDGTPFCHMFICGAEECNFDCCIDYEELQDAYNIF